MGAEAKTEERVQGEVKDKAETRSHWGLLGKG